MPEADSVETPSLPPFPFRVVFVDLILPGTRQLCAALLARDRVEQSPMYCTWYKKVFVCVLAWCVGVCVVCTFQTTLLRLNFHLFKCICINKESSQFCKQDIGYVHLASRTL